MNNALFLKVKFTKIGNKIKYQLPVKMSCINMKQEIPSSGIYDKNDGLFGIWFGNKGIDRLFKNRRSIIRKVCLNQIYDECDRTGLLTIQ